MNKLMICQKNNDLSTNLMICQQIDDLSTNWWFVKKFDDLPTNCYKSACHVLKNITDFRQQKRLAQCHIHYWPG